MLTFDQTPKSGQLYPTLTPTPVSNNEAYSITPAAYQIPEMSNNILNVPLLSPSAPELPVKHRESDYFFIVYTTLYVLELAALAFLVFSSRLFEYCYWEFGVFGYLQSTEKDLTYAHNKGKVDELYDELNCDKRFHYKECPDLCDLAKNLVKGKDVLIYFLVLQVFVSLMGWAGYFWSCFNESSIVNKRCGIIFHFTSILLYLISAIIYILVSDIFTLRDPSDDYYVFTDAPQELEGKLGAFIFLGLFVYMIAYRLGLILWR